MSSLSQRRATEELEAAPEEVKEEPEPALEENPETPAEETPEDPAAEPEEVNPEEISVDDAEV